VIITLNVIDKESFPHVQINGYIHEHDIVHRCTIQSEYKACMHVHTWIYTCNIVGWLTSGLGQNNPYKLYIYIWAIPP